MQCRRADDRAVNPPLARMQDERAVLHPAEPAVRADLVLERFWPKPLADPPVDFAREVARIAPDTTVRILAPGEAMDLLAL